MNDNLCYLTINCDTGQHSQFLRCFWVVQYHSQRALMQSVAPIPYNVWSVPCICIARIRQDGLKCVRFDHDMSLQAMCMTNLRYYCSWTYSTSNVVELIVSCHHDLCYISRFSIHDVYYTLPILVTKYNGWECKIFLGPRGPLETPSSVRSLAPKILITS